MKKVSWKTFFCIMKRFTKAFTVELCATWRFHANVRSQTAS